MRPANNDQVSAFARREFLRRGGLVAAGLALGPALLTACGGPGRAGESLTVWWSKGYYEEEDAAAARIIGAWSRATGRAVNLQFYSTPAMGSKLTSAVEAGRPPDIAYHQNARASLFAHQGQLADVSDVVDTLALTPIARSASRFYDNQRQVTSTFATPLLTWTIPIFHWKSMLTEIGLDLREAPRNWDGYWEFWREAQRRADRAGAERPPTAVGWSLSSAMEDTPEHFQYVLRAAGTALLDENNAIDVSGPGVRDGLEYTLRWISDLYSEGYTPRDSISWQSGGNNQVFLNQQVFMTPNGTLSIPGSVKENDPAAWADIGTSGWPEAVGGGAPTALAKFGRIMLFEDAGRVSEAKDLLRHLMDPANVQQYLEDGRGRWYPTLTPLTEQPYWTDNPDPNVRAVHEIFGSEGLAPDWRELSLAYSRVEDLNIWAKSLTRILIDGQDVAKATDDALRQVELLGRQFGAQA
ncbi:ABC transporter substrate-binding protein [Prauserella cavernicola]|uniref:Carbohydrate ABC transporter substrate-binding protein n=1 Tax=Prauserella cavernicola TaxID=2800127 RepID=A0A934QXS8_9PSEU|nr:ABC transporter substrate-binding protein [Prauserella cavernicola]MBK1787474.1 carbohydrate ABC transporter substrate-binding protein [Prauserella cavernicola]